MKQLNQYFFPLVRVIEKLVKIVKVQFSFNLRAFLVFLAFFRLQISNCFIFLRFPVLDFLNSCARSRMSGFRASDRKHVKHFVTHESQCDFHSL